MSIINTFPTTIANGQVEDATVVMSLFAWIQSQTNGNACPATTGSAMLKGNGAGGTITATAGTDYVAPTNTGNVAITGNVTVTGQEIVSAPAPLPSGGAGTFAYRGNGSYGGGYSLIDGTYNIGLYSVTGALNVGFGTSLGALTSKFNIDVNGNVQCAGGVTASGAVNVGGNVNANQFASTATGALGFGGTVAVGVYGDSSNIALRTPAASGQIFFQGSSGTNTYGNIGPAGINLNAGSFIGSGSGLTGSATALDAGVGTGQTWQKPARVGGTNYTNGTGKAIQIHVVFGGGTGGGGYVTIGGVQFGNGSSNQGSTSVSAIVPNGAVYSATATIAGITDWAELR